MYVRKKIRERERMRERERVSYKIITREWCNDLCNCLRPNLERGIDGENSLIVLLIKSKYLRLPFDESNSSRNWGVIL